ncbi:MAG: hypothetical protein RLT05_08565 [Bauldia litoralis]
MSVNEFNYSEPAELYIAKKQRAGKSSMTYRRFDTAANAIQFSMEELPGTSLAGTVLEVEEGRYHHKDIRKLYESSAYPLHRQIREDGDGAQA